MSSIDSELLALSASTFFIFFSPCNLNALRLKVPINLNPISTDESSAAAHQKQKQQLTMKVIM
jgi:hypothetical protein